MTDPATAPEPLTLRRRLVWPALLVLGLGGALAGWLAVLPASAGPAGPARLAQRRLVALVSLSYPLWTLVVPYLFRLLAAAETRGARTAAGYLATLPGPLLLLGLGAGLRGGAAELTWTGALLPGAALLWAYLALVAAACDLLRRVSVDAGQLVPTVLGLGAMLSVFLAGPAIEQAGDEARRTRLIRWAVEVNPILIASDALPGHDPLRTRRVYGRTPIGAYYDYDRPPWRTSLWRLLALAVAGAATAQGVRLRQRPRQAGAPSDR